MNRYQITFIFKFWFVTLLVWCGVSILRKQNSPILLANASCYFSVLSWYSTLLMNILDFRMNQRVKFMWMSLCFLFLWVWVSYLRLHFSGSACSSTKLERRYFIVSLEICLMERILNWILLHRVTFETFFFKFRPNFVFNSIM